MTSQAGKARMLLPYVIEHMNALEIAQYCDASGLSADPAINALVDRLLRQEDSVSPAQAEFEAQEELAYLAQVVREENDKTHKKFTTLAKKLIHRGRVTPPPGPRDKYRSTILAVLKRQGPLKRSELVTKVLAVCPSAGKSAIYRSIASAKEDQKIIAIGKVFYHLK